MVDVKKLTYLALLLVPAYLLYAAATPGPYDEFAKCLTKEGFSMGGTDTCPSCKNQKSLFGKSFKYIDYHNCDREGQWCTSMGVRLLPTWIPPRGEAVTGVQSLDSLSQMSGCSLEASDTNPVEASSCDSVACEEEV